MHRRKSTKEFGYEVDGERRELGITQDDGANSRVGDEEGRQGNCDE